MDHDRVKPNVADPRDSFGPVAERYVTSAVHNNPTALSRLIELVRPHGGKLLDIATGGGHAACAFAPFMDLTVATDITPNMLAVTRTSAKSKGLKNFVLSIAKAEHLPFKDNTFEGVVCRIAAHHFDDVPAFLREVSRVLIPGGWFLLVDNVGPEDHAAAVALNGIERDRDPSHMAYLSVSEWDSALCQAGFKVRHQEGSEKRIEVEDWLERINAPIEKRLGIRKAIEESQEELRAYLRPEVAQSSAYFTLREHLFLSEN